MKDTTAPDESAEPSREGCSESPTHEDARLVARFVEGDDAAFAQIVELYTPRITRLVFRLLAWQDGVEDVVQEVFIAALAARKRFRGRSGLATWLTAIAINQCRSHQRKQRLYSGLLRRTRERTPERRDPPADRAAIDAERAAQVREAVARLPTRYREMVVLRYLEEMSVDEVAGALGMKRNAVEVRLSRARRRLKTFLENPIEKQTDE